MKTHLHCEIESLYFLPSGDFKNVSHKFEIFLQFQQYNTYKLSRAYITRDFLKGYPCLYYSFTLPQHWQLTSAKLSFPTNWQRRCNQSSNVVTTSLCLLGKSFLSSEAIVWRFFVKSCSIKKLFTIITILERWNFHYKRRFLMPSIRNYKKNL